MISEKGCITSTFFILLEQDSMDLKINMVLRNLIHKLFCIFQIILNLFSPLTHDPKRSISFDELITSLKQHKVSWLTGKNPDSLSISFKIIP